MRVVAAALLSLLLILPLSAHDWTGVASRVESSLVKVTHTATDKPGAFYICGGFVIHKRHTHVLTAYHCIVKHQDEGAPEATDIRVDGLPAYVVAKWPDNDFVILGVGGVNKPSLDYRRKPVRKGLPVAALGFAYGLPTTTLLSGVIAAPAADWGVKEGLWLTVDRPMIGGMSGGPIFDLEGRVVGMSQKTDDLTGIGRPLAEMVELTKKFWD